MTSQSTIRTDIQIEQDVRQELIWDDRVNAADITVSVVNGEVTLSGTVPNYTQRGLASADAWRIAGVTDVNNLLTVSIPTTIIVPADQEIRSNVENTLRWNTDVDSSNIDVTVNNGIVTLEGTVGAYWEKWRAENLASALGGVVMVENHLTVVPTESYTDQRIAEDIESALDRNLYVIAEDITVEVEKGVVTLTGTVPTYNARLEAYSAAINTLGVLQVKNNIVVT